MPVPIWNCPENLRFQCPKQWEKLKETNQEHIRFCTACEQEVYFCDSLQETKEHTAQGRCIAFAGNSDLVPKIIVGQPDLTRLMPFFLANQDSGGKKSERDV